MDELNFQPVDALSDDQLDQYAQTLPEIVNNPVLSAQFEMRDLGQTRRDFQTATGAQWVLSNMRGRMQDAKGEEYFVITRSDRPECPIGMAARTEQPLRRLGSEKHTFTPAQMAELGSHAVAWLDPARRYSDSLSSLTRVYRRLGSAGRNLQGEPVNVWTTETVKALEKGPRLRPMLFMGQALHLADYTRDNPGQSAPYAAKHTTKPLFGVRQQVLFHTADRLSFDPATTAGK